MVSRVVPGDIGHYGPAFTKQNIEQRTFPDVGRTENQQGQPLTQRPTGGKASQQGVNLDGDLKGLVAEFFQGGEGQILLGKINPGFHLRKGMQQRIPELKNSAGKLPRQLPEGQITSRSRTGPNKVDHSLGARQIDTPIEKGAKGELSGLRESRSAIDQQIENPGDQSGTSVAMDLGDILAGKGAGCTHDNSQDFIKGKSGRGRVSPRGRAGGRKICPGERRDEKTAAATLRRWRRRFE